MTAKSYFRFYLNIQFISYVFINALLATVNNNNYYLFIVIVLSPGVGGYFTCKQNMKLVTTKFKSGGLHEKRVVVTWNLGNRLSICF